jgi:hypothetical protein
VLVAYPWTDSATALRYIDHKGITYLILRDGDRDRRPYLTEWLRHPPDSRMVLVRTFEGAAGETRVYEWRTHSTAALNDAGTASPR